MKYGLFFSQEIIDIVSYYKKKTDTPPLTLLPLQEYLKYWYAFKNYIFISY